MYFLTLDREVPAPRERVWRALTDPDVLSTWFGAVEVDLRHGGRLTLRGNRQVGSGSYYLVKPPCLVAFTWQQGLERSLTRVRIELSRVSENDTRISVTQRAFPDEATRDRYLAGWHETLDRLPVALRP
jgi:uncharacterized protein YndB with AHSA1/START domain